jgi:hypothetical protein
MTMYAPGLKILVVSLAFNALGEILAHRTRSDHEGSLNLNGNVSCHFIGY